MRNRLRSHLTYANVISTLALFLVLAGGTTLAATGGNFILGQSNSASSTTSLTRTGANAGKGLQVTNTSTGTGATALGLNVASGHPPFTVNSGTKVANLNADRVDGLDGSSGFGLVYLGTDPQTGGGVVIRWNELGAQFGTTGSNDDKVRIYNFNPSQSLYILYGSTQLTLGPGRSDDVHVGPLTTTRFLVWSADGLRSWDVVCGTPYIDTVGYVRCQGLASRAG